ncbi:MAG: ArsR family transcriptional regulator [Methanothrix sp.]|jgi:Predicted transcriptional regulator|uniref:ArsR family transcriptional regulator n=1 Tax=Methanothrix thermoacetophila (strain DSM 6194 / JCM 14653 / NBRC 101360 / PT) TaxID=349307 RepID=A0B657_METTP|nr:MULTISPECIES: hypothetical protein [Methanothrix]ABK14181.1 conserved hypothetical protein [Methanothrix thermoacetophila PT]MBC7079720.1 ArsR family transcriptional regulator [Methanothrix sp.]NPU87795.1 ArsR family transcriptional regulator [Methanothrix sp.]
MKDYTVKVLDDRDLEFIEALRSLGVQRNVAALVTYLSNTKEVSSREIEMGTGLRQPEVSIGMRYLRQNGWIDERDVKGEGKGRPMKVYTLKVSIDDIIKHFEDQKLKESAKAMESIRKLRELTSAT